MTTNITLGLIVAACIAIWWAHQPTKIEHRTHQLERQLEDFEFSVMTGR